MPFITPEDRKRTDETGAWKAVGDLCYMKYKPMIEAWRRERRWTTAHNIFQKTFDVNDEQAAKTLAFLVFFVKEVMPYEDAKVKENGDIL